MGKVGSRKREYAGALLMNRTNGVLAELRRIREQKLEKGIFIEVDIILILFNLLNMP